MAIILDGKKLSERILENIRKKVKKSGEKLRIAGILVGDDEASKVFLFQKEKACELVGVGFNLYRFPGNIAREDLVQAIKEIAQDSENQGVIIQLPLPKQIDAQEILNLIPAEKDIDLLSEKSLGSFCAGKSLVLPPVLSGILELFSEYNIKIKGKNIVIVGGGRLVGRPISIWLANEGITATTISSPIPNLFYFTKNADILISGAGSPGLIRGSMVKEKSVIVDVGIVKKRGKLTGDVDFKSVVKKASFITPVPGGLGPMTVAMVIQNLIVLNKIK